MALMHPHTTMSPTKLELLAAWLPSQPWFAGDAAQLTRIGEYRLDDPEGEVGLNGILVTAGDDTVYHVPLTYRGAPLDESEEFFVGTSEHGVLGTRWVTAAIGDPVYRAVLAQTIAQGGSGAEEFVTDESGAITRREIVVPISGSGEAGAQVPEMWAAEVSISGESSVASTGFATLSVIHVLDGRALTAMPLHLSATWPGQGDPVVLATLS